MGCKWSRDSDGVRWQIDEGDMEVSRRKDVHEKATYSR